jgi:hypothetical protein
LIELEHIKRNIFARITPCHDIKARCHTFVPMTGKTTKLAASRMYAQVANGFILVCVLLSWVLDLILDDALGCQRKQFSMDGQTAIQAYLSPDTLP